MSPIARDGSDLPLTALIAGFMGCGLLIAAGVSLSGALATSVGCLMLLVFGLPHGTLDLHRIRDQARGPATGLIVLLAVYLGLALAMFAVWRFAPVLALAIFIVVAVIHFSEDWTGTGSGLLEKGLALGLLAAPTLLSRPELDGLFIALTGRTDAAVVTDFLTLVLPTALVVAVVALGTLWSAGHRQRAAAGALALTGMIVLPPVIGFALYFCLFHSPSHLGESLRAVARTRRHVWVRIILPMTAAAGVIAAGLYGLELRADAASRLVAASFMTLSILTMPHMLAPFVIAWMARPGLIAAYGAAGANAGMIGIADTSSR